MHEEYLGEGYHDKVRKLLGADNKICTNTMIDADINIGAMKKIITPYLQGGPVGFGLAGQRVEINTEDRFATLQQGALFILAAVLCSPIISRAKVQPFLNFKYQKNWGKKQKELMRKGHMWLDSLQVKGAVQ
ncbi:MAG: hypothetical protein HPY66_1669 [Firmicutes bacterium]|nr:hypothetical protein [Bacillota bacterium]